MADSQKKTANLFNAFISGISIDTTTGAEVPYDSGFTSDFIAVDNNAIYSYSGGNDTISTCFFAYDSAKAYIGRSVNVAISATTIKTVTTVTTGYTVFASSLTGNTNPIAYIRVGHLSGTQAAVDEEQIMLNSGSTPLPYEPYWQHSLRKLTTATEAVENPLYSDGTAITSYTIKGNTVQNGTPTPSNPVPVVGVGELETTGEHTGEYKIPISNGQQTTNIYLGSTQTTRQIGKYTFDGSNIFTTQRSAYRNNTAFFATTAMTGTGITNRPSINNYFVVPSAGTNPQSLDYACSGFHPSDLFSSYYYLRVPYDVIGMTDSNTDNEFITALNTWLSSLYNSGSPMIAYYALATAETAAVNEPLMKIGNYADTLSNATSIPTIEGANSITVDTTVQPSEFTATWTGWHDASVKEWDGSDWS